MEQVLRGKGYWDDLLRRRGVLRYERRLGVLFGHGRRSARMEGEGRSFGRLRDHSFRREALHLGTGGSYDIVAPKGRNLEGMVHGGTCEVGATCVGRRARLRRGFPLPLRSVYPEVAQSRLAGVGGGALQGGQGRVQARLGRGRFHGVRGVHGRGQLAERLQEDELQGTYGFLLHARGARGGVQGGGPAPDRGGEGGLWAPDCGTKGARGGPEGHVRSGTSGSLVRPGETPCRGFLLRLSGPRPRRPETRPGRGTCLLRSGHLGRGRMSPPRGGRWTDGMGGGLGQDPEGVVPFVEGGDKVRPRRRPSHGSPRKFPSPSLWTWNFHPSGR